MIDESPAVDRIDHVELDVPDRREAAKWYRAVFGLEVVEAYRRWAERGGPLMVETPEGGAKLALFEAGTGGADGDGDGDETGPGSGGEAGTAHFDLVAFRTDATTFRRFVDALADRDDVDVAGPGDVVDHDLSWSLYFTDPWDHRFEITTYDYDAVAADLGRRAE
jgi:catechol 2,3-dioxygenase-like lactoylglutathione lyase family enzyme